MKIKKRSSSVDLGKTAHMFRADPSGGLLGGSDDSDFDY